MTVRPRKGILAIGVLAIVAWLAARGIPSAIESVREMRWRLADRVRLLEQSRREISQEQEIFDSAKTIKEGIMALAPRLLSGNTAAEAADALNGLVSLAADRSSARLTGVTAEVDSATVGSLHRVALRAAFDADIRGLVAMLASLGGHETILVTDRLQVIAAEPGGAGGGPEVLRVEMTVRGWFQEGGSADRRSGGQEE